MVFEPLAIAEAVLTPDERDLGVLLIDIGAGTTGWALFEDGEPRHTGVLPVGAGHFTNDLAMVLRTPYAEAEKIKLKDGCCLRSMVNEDEGISVPTVAGGAPRVVPRREICEILAAARRGDAVARARGAGAQRLGRLAARRHRAHRRRRAARRAARAGGAGVRRQRPLRPAAGARRPRRRPHLAHLVDRRRPAALGRRRRLERRAAGPQRAASA